MANGDVRSDVGGLVPRPDPTVLTTEQLFREIANLEQRITVRTEADAKAVVLLHEEIGRRLESLALFREREVQGVLDLMAEKFKVLSTIVEALSDRIEDRDKEVATRFQERDTRSEREARDNKIAVDAAFAAAKEAVAENNKSSALANDKSEATFTKQIDGIQLLISTTNKATDEKISDLKDQLGRIASGSQARREVTTENRTNNQWVIYMVVAVIGVLILIAQVALHFVPAK